MACPYDVVVVVIPVFTLQRPRVKSLLASGVYNIKGKRLVGAIQPVIIVRSQRNESCCVQRTVKLKLLRMLSQLCKYLGLLNGVLGVPSDQHSNEAVQMNLKI